MNPVSSKATDFFKFQITSTDEGVILDYTSSVFVEAKPSEILLKDANFNDPTVDTETMLSLTFENVHAAIPEGSYLEIDLQELDLGDIACFGILNIEDTNLTPCEQKISILMSPKFQFLDHIFRLHFKAKIRIPFLFVLQN